MSVYDECPGQQHETYGKRKSLSPRYSSERSPRIEDLRRQFHFSQDSAPSNSEMSVIDEHLKRTVLTWLIINAPAR